MAPSCQDPWLSVNQRALWFKSLLAKDSNTLWTALSSRQVELWGVVRLGTKH